MQKLAQMALLHHADGMRFDGGQVQKIMVLELLPPGAKIAFHD